MPPFWHLQHIGASWADAIPVLHRQAPQVATVILQHFEQPATAPRPHPGSTSSAPVNPGTGMGTPQLATTSCPAATTRQRRNCSQGRPNPAGNNTRQPQSTPQHVKTFIPHSTSQPSHPGFAIRSIRQQKLSPLSHTLQGSHTQTKSSGSSCSVALGFHYP